MTDTMNDFNTPAMVSEYMLPQWKIFADKVAEIDEQLNTDGGRAALAKEAITGLPDGVEAQITNDVTAMVSGLSASDLFAVDALIKRVLRSVAAQVSKYVEDNKKEATELPEEQVLELREARKAAVNGANQLRTAVIVTNPQWAGTSEKPSEALNAVFPAFDNLRGAIGKRAPSKRLKGAWAWAVNGRAVAGNKVDDAAKVVGVPARVLKESLDAYNIANGIEFDWKNPPEEFSFTHTSGDKDDPDKQLNYTISATSISSDSDDEDDEPDFEEVDGEDDIFES